MATKSKKDGGQRYDWEMIKLDYVTDPTSSQQKTARAQATNSISAPKACAPSATAMPTRCSSCINTKRRRVKSKVFLSLPLKVAMMFTHRERPSL